jgi:hypothetical protein
MFVCTCVVLFVLPAGPWLQHLPSVASRREISDVPCVSALPRSSSSCCCCCCCWCCSASPLPPHQTHAVSDPKALSASRPAFLATWRCAVLRLLSTVRSRAVKSRSGAYVSSGRVFGTCQQFYVCACVCRRTLLISCRQRQRVCTSRSVCPVLALRVGTAK